MSNTKNRGQSIYSKCNTPNHSKADYRQLSAPMEPDGKDILIAALKDPFFQVRVLALQKTCQLRISIPKKWLWLKKLPLPILKI